MSTRGLIRGFDYAYSLEPNNRLKPLAAEKTAGTTFAVLRGPLMNPNDSSNVPDCLVHYKAHYNCM